MGSYKYNHENLEQCIRILIGNAKRELEPVHNFTKEFTYAIEKDICRTIRIFSRWDSDEDCFSATSLSFWRIEGSKLLIELAVYDKFSGYKATYGVGVCNTPQEALDWLEKEETLINCIESADYLINLLDD